MKSIFWHVLVLLFCISGGTSFAASGNPNALTYTGKVTKVYTERNSDGSVAYFHVYFNQTMSPGTCSESGVQADPSRAVVQAGTPFGDAIQRLGAAAILTQAVVTWSVIPTICDVSPSVVSLQTFYMCPPGAPSC